MASRRSATSETPALAASQLEDNKAAPWRTKAGLPGASGWLREGFGGLRTGQTPSDLPQGLPGATDELRGGLVRSNRVLAAASAVRGGSFGGLERVAPCRAAPTSVRRSRPVLPVGSGRGCSVLCRSRGSGCLSAARAWLGLRFRGTASSEGLPSLLRRFAPPPFIRRLPSAIRSDIVGTLSARQPGRPMGQKSQRLGRAAWHPAWRGAARVGLFDDEGPSLPRPRDLEFYAVALAPVVSLDRRPHRLVAPLGK